MTGTWHLSTCTQFLLLSVVEESTKLQKEGLDTGAGLAPLGRSEVEVIEEKKQIKSEGPKNHPSTCADKLPIRSKSFTSQDQLLVKKRIGKF